MRTTRVAYLFVARYLACVADHFLSPDHRRRGILVLRWKRRCARELLVVGFPELVAKHPE